MMKSTTEPRSIRRSIKFSLAAGLLIIAPGLSHAALIEDAANWYIAQLESVSTFAEDRTQPIIDWLNRLIGFEQALTSLRDMSTIEVEQLNRDLADSHQQMLYTLGEIETADDFLWDSVVNFAEQLMVQTSGRVTYADGSPAQAVIVVQLQAFEEGLVTGDPSALPVPVGVGVTDATGNYTIHYPGGLIWASRNLMGLAQSTGQALGPMIVQPLQLLPATPPLKLLTYSATGTPSATDGDEPLAVWEYVGL